MKNSPLLPVYRRANIKMVRGEGAYLFDDDGNRYLDFSCGIAVNLLGHSHPSLLAALHQQADRLWHCSNLYLSDALENFSNKLIEKVTFADKVFLCSSGTEAVECAIKMARRYHYTKSRPDKIHIIVAEGAFHGRTMGALSACSNSKSKEGFSPMLKGFDTVPFNDIDALEKAITPHTAAIMLEPIQGEGGVRRHSYQYLQTARQLATENDILLIYDEIQCGYGRTGELFSYMGYDDNNGTDIAPDIMTAAKGMGGGFPIAATFATEKASMGMTRGTHGSTYGGNPLACAVGDAVLYELHKNGCALLKNVKRQGEKLKRRLQEFVTIYKSIFKEEVRGTGLMLGLVVRDEAQKYEICDSLRDNGLLTAASVTDAIRILPPLNIEDKHIDEAMQIMYESFTA